MELHYFTFGCGQVMDGHVQPILAHNSNDARRAMTKAYGDDWGFHYNEKDWGKIRDKVTEIPLPLIDARQVIA